MCITCAPAAPGGQRGSQITWNGSHRLLLATTMQVLGIKSPGPLQVLLAAEPALQPQKPHFDHYLLKGRLRV